MSKKKRWSYYIDEKLCMNCATCELECREGAIYIEDYRTFAINVEKCSSCARCYWACPVGAVQRVSVEEAI